MAWQGVAKQEAQIFKTGAFNRSATPPSLVFRAFIAFPVGRERSSAQSEHTSFRSSARCPDYRGCPALDAGKEDRSHRRTHPRSALIDVGVRAPPLAGVGAGGTGRLHKNGTA